MVRCIYHKIDNLNHFWTCCSVYIHILYSCCIAITSVPSIDSCHYPKLELSTRWTVIPHFPLYPGNNYSVAVNPCIVKSLVSFIIETESLSLSSLCRIIYQWMRNRNVNCRSSHWSTIPSLLAVMRWNTDIRAVKSSHKKLVKEENCCVRII